MWRSDDCNCELILCKLQLNIGHCKAIWYDYNFVAIKSDWIKKQVIKIVTFCLQYTTAHIQIGRAHLWIGSNTESLHLIIAVKIEELTYSQRKEFIAVNFCWKFQESKLLQLKTCILYDLWALAIAPYNRYTLPHHTTPGRSEKCRCWKVIPLLDYYVSEIRFNWISVSSFVWICVCVCF